MHIGVLRKFKKVNVDINDLYYFIHEGGEKHLWSRLFRFFK